jgi:hypothetical protein
LSYFRFKVFYLLWNIVLSINTIFGSTRKFDEKSGRIITVTTGPVRQETVYNLDFNPENVDMLYQKTWDGKNPYFKPDKKSNKRVVLVVKDAVTNVSIEVYWHSLERSLELFKTKSFVELFNGSYLPPAVREEKLRLSQGLTGETNTQPPTIPENNNNSNTNTVNNTSAYK